MKSLNNFLNNITMYRLVLRGLQILAVIAVILGFFGKISYSPLSILASALILLVTCWITNYVFAKLFKAQRNEESAYITAMILSLLLAPPTGLHDIWILLIAAAAAMASKYVLAWRKKHFFNPAAISAVIIGLFGSGAAVWWVATPWMVVPVAVLGFLILKKLQRFPLFGMFALVSLAISLISGSASLHAMLLSFPLLFLGTVMLTEPTTVPPTRNLQMIYGAIVGLFFTLQFHFGPVYSTPELALILGNIFSYFVSSKANTKLFFVEKQQASAHVYDFVFRPERKFKFTAGQYIDWTLEHPHPDDRGDRRTFTISSSPMGSMVKLGVRIDLEHGSTFKKALFNMKKGDSLMVSDLSGDFVMPKDTTKKLAFIAGGVGITPYRSMIGYLKDKGEKRDVVLLYACATASDFAFGEEIEDAKKILPLKTVYVATNASPTDWAGRTGYITADVIKAELADYMNRDFYISGPEAMVENYEKLLIGMNIPVGQIHTDYFPGY